MRQILIAVGIALAVSILLTPALIKLFTRQGFGHEIREDGPPSHQKKRGTPSMGGVAILAGIWAGYLGTQLVGLALDGRGPSASGLLVLGLATALGAVGFIDDLIKIRRSRNLGLNKTAKTVGQLVAAVLFGVLALQFRNPDGLTPGSAELSYVREIATVTLAPMVFVLFVVILVSAWSNAVNFTDGLDGLAIVPVMIAAATFLLIAYLVGNIRFADYLQLHYIAGTGELTVFLASLVGAGLGFLWYNAPPAMVFMGDTGSLPLGGALGAVAVAVKHEIVLAIVGGLFVLETVSVIVQVVSFKLTGKRVFRMAPIHHHFEQLGWKEPTIVIRFWIVAVVLALIGLSTLKLR
jgi:phospho-N-acetylmuramoyl-pentapeptide-transferase